MAGGRRVAAHVSPSPGQSTCLVRRLRKRKERGVYAASAWDNPNGAAKFPDCGTALTMKRPEGRAPAELGAWG